MVECSIERVEVRGSTFLLDISLDTERGEYSVQCKELPGAIEQGSTVTEAIANGKDAIESVLAFLGSTLVVTEVIQF